MVNSESLRCLHNGEAHSKTDATTRHEYLVCNNATCLPTLMVQYDFTVCILKEMSLKNYFFSLHAFSLFFLLDTLYVTANQCRPPEI